MTASYNRLGKEQIAPLLERACPNASQLRK
jgi:hypothetical protein